MPNCPSCNSSNAPGTTQCPSCGATISEPTTDIVDDVRKLLEQGRKIEAVKLLKNHTGCTLKEAKDAVEAVQQGASPLPTEASVDLEEEVVRLLQRGETLAAIKLYRKRMERNLRDSKHEVETIAARHGLKVESVGCHPVLVGILVVALIAIGVGVAVLAQR